MEVCCYYSWLELDSLELGCAVSSPPGPPLDAACGKWIPQLPDLARCDAGTFRLEMSNMQRQLVEKGGIPEVILTSKSVFAAPYYPVEKK